MTAIQIMTTIQITRILNDKGFDTETKDNRVYVSLYRKVYINEIKIALNYPDNLFGKSGKRVVIIGKEI